VVKQQRRGIKVHLFSPFTAFKNENRETAICKIRKLYVLDEMKRKKVKNFCLRCADNKKTFNRDYVFHDFNSFLSALFRSVVHKMFSIFASLLPLGMHNLYY
jgi:hypothetical protein